MPMDLTTWSIYINAQNSASEHGACSSSVCFLSPQWCGCLTEFNTQKFGLASMCTVSFHHGCIIYALECKGLKWSPSSLTIGMKQIHEIWHNYVKCSKQHRTLLVVWYLIWISFQCQILHLHYNTLYNVSLCMLVEFKANILNHKDKILTPWRELSSLHDASAQRKCDTNYWVRLYILTLTLLANLKSKAGPFLMRGELQNKLSWVRLAGLNNHQTPVRLSMYHRLSLLFQETLNKSADYVPPPPHHKRARMFYWRARKNPTNDKTLSKDVAESKERSTWFQTWWSCNHM